MQAQRVGVRTPVEYWQDIGVSISFRGVPPTPELASLARAGIHELFRGGFGEARVTLTALAQGSCRAHVDARIGARRWKAAAFDTDSVGALTRVLGSFRPDAMEEPPTRHGPTARAPRRPQFPRVVAEAPAHSALEVRS